MVSSSFLWQYLFPPTKSGSGGAVGPGRRAGLGLKGRRSGSLVLEEVWKAVFTAFAAASLRVTSLPGS